MKFVRIASQEASRTLAELGDDLVCAVAYEEDVAAERAEIDALIESVDAELAASARGESAALSLDHRDAHPARRHRRREDAAVLRSLPSRLSGDVPAAGEAA